MHKWMVAAVALTLLIASSDISAKGSRKGGKGCSTGGASCGMDYGYGSGGCSTGPSVSYPTVTEYVTVTRQVSESVPETKNQEFTEYETKEVRTPKKETQKWVEMVQKTKKEKVTTQELVTEKVKQKYQVTVPATKTVEQSYQVATPKHTTTKQTATRYVPQTKAVTQTVPVTTYEKIPVYGCQMVSVPSGGCGSGSQGCGQPCGAPSGGYTTVSVPTVGYQCVPRTSMQTYTANVTEMVPQQYTYDVTTVSYEYKTEKRNVQVQTWETREQEQEVTVANYKPVTREVTVTYYAPEEKSKEVEVTVITYQTTPRKVTRPVTTYNVQTRTVTETVPVTRCVPVYTAPAASYGSGCGPVVMPSPCGY